MSSRSLLFPTTSCTELVESDKEHEDIKRLLDHLQDKIRAAWPSSVRSKHSRKGVIDLFQKTQWMFLHPATSCSSFHTGPKTALICATGLGEGEYRSEDVAIYKYTVSQSHHRPLRSETVVSITVTQRRNQLKKRGLVLFRKSHCFLDVAECHKCEHTAPQICPEADHLGF